MTPMQAIKAATSNAASLFGWQDNLGTIEPGKLADLIAVEENPLIDITELQRVKFVMLDGNILRDDWHGLDSFGLLRETRVAKL